MPYYCIPLSRQQVCSTMRMLHSRNHLTEERWAQSPRQHGEGTIRWLWEERTLPVSSWLLLPGDCAVAEKGLRRVRVSSKYLFTDLVGLIS